MIRNEGLSNLTGSSDSRLTPVAQHVLSTGESATPNRQSNAGPLSLLKPISRVTTDTVVGQPKKMPYASLRATARFRTKEIDRPEQEEVQRPPELTFDVRHNVAVEGRDFMVASANAHATSVGYRVLEAGGTAIDALIAVQAMLTLTEPQSSSLIGGGAAITYFDHKIGEAVVIDGRETAPMAAQPDRFLGPDGRPATFDDAVHGGRAVGVPGNLAALAVAHRINGKLPWSALLEPTIALAKRGFEISPRLAAMIAHDPILRAEPSSTVMKQYFYSDGGRGEPLPAGFVLKNPQLAEALEMIGEVGPKRAFYQGPIGKDFVETARAAHRHPSDITEEDLHVYQAKLRVPVSYRFPGPDGTKYELCSMPPPGGGTSLIEVVGVLDHIGISTLLPNWSKQQQWTADFVHVVTQAQELALADKTHYLHDPAFRRPRKFLTERSYLRQRADLIRLDRTMDKVQPGGAAARHDARGLPPEFPSTTHITIVDKYGNVASCTSSIEDMNGSRLMSGAYGYTLNNHMSDFKLDPLENGRLVAGHVQPGARPPSSMAPTIVLARGTRSVRQFYAGLGSPGGPSIPAYTFKTITGLLLGLDPAEAAAMPNFRGLPGGLIELEEDTPVVELAPELERRGHRVSIANMNSGIHAVVRTRDGRLIGGADGRREGTVEGR